MESCNNPYWFFGYTLLASAHFLSHWWYVPQVISDVLPLWSVETLFHCLQTNGSDNQSPLLRLVSELFSEHLFLIQRPCSLYSTTMLLLTTNSFLNCKFTSFTSCFFSIPSDGCVNFIRNVTRVIIDVCEWKAAFTSECRGIRPSEWTVCAVTGSLMSCNFLDCGSVILNKNKFRLLNCYYSSISVFI